MIMPTLADRLGLAEAAPEDPALVAEAVAGAIGTNVLLGGMPGEAPAGLAKAVLREGRRSQSWTEQMQGAMDAAAAGGDLGQAIDLLDARPDPSFDRPLNAAVRKFGYRATEAGQRVSGPTGAIPGDVTVQAMKNLVLAHGVAPGGDDVRELYNTAAPLMAEAFTRGAVTERRLADASMGLRSYDPLMADRVQQLAVQRTTYLYETMPKAPDGFGPGWEPSDGELWEWARRVAAADRPDVIDEEIAAGAVMPETVQTLERLSPAYLERVRTEMTSVLADPATKVPYERRMGISLVLGLDDPELRPDAIAAAQTRAQSVRREGLEPAGDGTQMPGPDQQRPSMARYAPGRMKPVTHESVKMEMTRAQRLDER